MEFYQLKEFEADVKSLVKRYPSLKEDLELLKVILHKYPEERPPFSNRIEDLEINTCIIQIKKIACKTLKASGLNSGLRLVYAYEPEKNQAGKESGKITFIELYHKNDKQMADKIRISKNFK